MQRAGGRNSHGVFLKQKGGQQGQSTVGKEEGSQIPLRGASPPRHYKHALYITASGTFIATLAIFLLHNKFPAILGDWELGFLDSFYPSVSKRVSPTGSARTHLLIAFFMKEMETEVAF